MNQTDKIRKLYVPVYKVFINTENPNILTDKMQLGLTKLNNVPKSFNSKVVRFKELIKSLIGSSLACFNSKVVRFKDDKERLTNPKYFSFNSKVVRFKVTRVSISPKATSFQFQSGSIQRVHKFSFSSVNNEFQFQSGAIQRIVPIIQQPLLVGFNSKVVRFKGCPGGENSHRYFVSIPKWCDSKR